LAKKTYLPFSLFFVPFFRQFFGAFSDGKKPDRPGGRNRAPVLRHGRAGDRQAMPVDAGAEMLRGQVLSILQISVSANHFSEKFLDRVPAK
jgi:hypothetical protein